MSSNQIIAIRIANIGENQDIAIDELIDYDNLHIHVLKGPADLENKKRYFRVSEIGSRVKILDVLEGGLKVAVVFNIIKDDLQTTHFHVYHFNTVGKLVELWGYS